MDITKLAESMCADMIYAAHHVCDRVTEFAKNVFQISIKPMLRSLSRLS
jgi:hypothetical protein